MKKDDWSDDEIRAACKSYLWMQGALGRGERVNKSNLYKELARGPLAGRSTKSVDYRFRNISAVLRDRGEKWVRGHAPAKNVGSRVFQTISNSIDEIRTSPSKKHPILTSEGSKTGLDEPESPEFRKAVKQALLNKKIPRPIGNAKPLRKNVQSDSFARDPNVVAYVERRANGRCEKCKFPAPFLRQDGTPYLEVHHIIPLSEEGEDTVFNAVGLCPNCHRECHHSDRTQKNQKLLLKLIGELEAT